MLKYSSDVKQIGYFMMIARNMTATELCMHMQAVSDLPQSASSRSRFNTLKELYLESVNDMNREF